ncbi:MAG: class I SAM-dependent methyltransferase [Runella slithyformis]|jgi:SAM-dependent methyltransferase|nr:MAG: class I SAM-dependent methyltransferase [Runella slithyformis]TAE94548.1 MAG: class I SAM-dependent methyltransferase [Runella slithyformis]TAF25486.1 MAG: class I SAM-dependent methyltransferase [Runella slithyformis]TAF43806.1 MAG: class I SAM-dependent methyltransferase [Runella slithyformis]TAF79884.1 MAG: class I SAM-dependent methyltransferase [Runella slithyformis]
MSLTRAEALPTDPATHYRIRPPFYHSRWYYLNQLRQLVEWARDNYVLPLAKHQRIKLTDYGCGTKPYISIFKHENIEYLGIDLAWNPHADIIIGSDSRIQTSDNSIDVVLSTQVLEHVEDPEGYLAEAYRILKPGGLLLLTTHGYWMYHPDPTDYWRWTSAGLQKIVVRAGFEVVAFRGIIGRMGMGLQLFQDGLLYKLPPFLRPVAAVPLQFLIMIFDKLTTTKARDMDACTYLVVAQKALK